MTIPESSLPSKMTSSLVTKRKIPTDLLIIGCVLVSVSGAFALGMVAERQGGVRAKDDRLWIENLSQTEIANAESSAIASSSESSTANTISLSAKLFPSVKKVPKVSHGKKSHVDNSKKHSSEAFSNTFTNNTTTPTTSLPAGGGVVASKTGHTYYLPWCGTAKRIKDENKVSFVTRDAAEKAGYKAAKNCKGL